MKKILGFSHYYATKNRGGGEIMFHEILKQLVKDGHSVDAIATTNIGEPEVMDGVNVFHGQQYKDVDLSKYDIIITQFAEAFYITDKARSLGKKVVYIVHNTMQETNNYLHTKKPDLAIFNTDWVMKFHKYTGNSIVVHPPVYASNHSTKKGDMITLINLTEPKGVGMFYNMAMHLPQFNFLGVEGGYWKERQKYIPRRNITFQKNTDNMKRDVWSKTKILLMPSSYESYGMAAVEALASGIPVLAFPTPGLKESLGEAGIFTPTNSVWEWRNELVKLMTDEKYYEEKSKQALKRSSEINPEEELKSMSKKVKRL